MNPRSALRMTTTRMIHASTHSPIIILVKPAPSSTYTRMLRNWEKKRMTAPRFLPSGSRFGPCCCKRRDASWGSRPFEALVLKRFTTSSTDRACQAGVALAEFGITVALISPAPCGRGPRHAAGLKVDDSRHALSNPDPQHLKNLHEEQLCGARDMSLTGRRAAQRGHVREQKHHHPAMQQLALGSKWTTDCESQAMKERVGPSPILTGFGVRSRRDQVRRKETDGNH